MSEQHHNAQEAYQPQREIAESMMGERLSDKSYEAASTSEFLPTPELMRGLEGYYETHYAMAAVIESSLGGDVSPQLKSVARQETLNGIIETSLFSSEELTEKVISLVDYGNIPGELYAQEITPLLAAVSLALSQDPDNKKLQRSELMAMNAACRALFSEASVGITTVGEKELDTVKTLHGKVMERIVSSGLFEEGRGNPKTYRAKDIGSSHLPLTHRFAVDFVNGNPGAGIEKAQKLFWEDSRFAGQLLFHNTIGFNELRASGSLMPRRMQLATYGQMQFQTAEKFGDSHHSPTVHWSEEYDPQSYRGEQSNPTGGTIAVPLWRVTEIAPYARDSEYGVLILKDEAVEDIVPLVTLNDGTTFLGSGGSDRQGVWGTDRTFYSSPKDVEPDAPIESAPDGYSIPIDEDTVWVQLGKQDAERSIRYGTGQHYPDIHLIDVEDVYDIFKTDGIDKQASYKEREQKIKDEIKDLQHKSISKRPRELVVPLRSGVMDFYVHDDGDPRGKSRARFYRLVA